MKRCWMIVGNVLLFILFTVIVFYFVDKADRALFHRRPESVAGVITIPSPEHIKWTLAVVFVLCIKRWWITVGKLLLFVVSTVAVVVLAAEIDRVLFDRNYCALTVLWILCGVFVWRTGFGLYDIILLVVVPIVAIGPRDDLYWATMLWIISSGVLLWSLGTRNRRQEAESSTVVQKHLRKDEAVSRERKSSPSSGSSLVTPASDTKGREKPRPAAPKINQLDRKPRDTEPSTRKRPPTRRTPFSWFYLQVGSVLIMVPEFVAWAMRYCVLFPVYISIAAVIGYYLPLLVGVLMSLCVIALLFEGVFFFLLLVVVMQMIFNREWLIGVVSECCGLGWGFVMDLASVYWPDFLLGLPFWGQMVVVSASFMLGHVACLGRVYYGLLIDDYFWYVPPFTLFDIEATHEAFRKTGKYRLIHHITLPGDIENLLHTDPQTLFKNTGIVPGL